MKARIPRALVYILLSLGLAGAAAASGPGAVVEKVGEGSALEKAGLLPGDLLLAWEREGEGGEIRTAFDWLRVKAEQAPRGTVRLRGERNGAAISFDVARGDWEARVRPWMVAEALRTYAEGRRRIEAGDVDGGAALWEGLADLRPWILLETGAARSNAGDPEKARSSFQAGLEGSADAQVRVAFLDALGQSYLNASDTVRAEAAFRSALETAEAANAANAGESLQAAAMRGRLGAVLRRQNRVAEAAQLYAAALETRERLAPGSLEVADSLNQLAGLAWTKGDVAEFYELSRRALEIQERWAPDSLAAAGILNHVAISALERGLFEEGRTALQRALAIQERRAPGSLQVSMSLANLGGLARQMGDLDAAEDLLRRALEIRKKLAPESSGVAVTISNLAMIARERGDLARAAELFQASLAIWQKAAPQGLGVAANQNALGFIARMQGDLDKAWDLHSRALEMREKIAPGSPDSAESLGHLARVAEARGDLKLALDVDRRALSVWQRLAPGSIDEALTLQAMGRLHRREGRTEEAARLLARAVDALESQMGRLGGSQEARARYRAGHGEIYRDAVEVELERGRAAEAFHLVERSRARSFLALLAERDLAFGDLPEALERSRRDNAARYDQKLRELAQAVDEEAKAALRRELDLLRQERERIAEEIREASPRTAALREPQPLDLATARQALDPGTLALSYSVGKDKTALFALTREGGLQVRTLPAGEEKLRREVEGFLERVRSQGKPAADLYGELIGPVADLVERSERVLILPDGPLHRLPFGALVHDGRFLIEEKPLHTALSLTVYATLRAASRAQGATNLVAFGDPRFPKGMQTKSGLAPGLRSFDWSSLPYSRSEVERIARIHPGALVYLGEEATEERAKSVRDARILHFATHGYTDDRSPLDSALVLTIPDELSKSRDNGLLQVWEIFEKVRVDADLVVLSACESALGRELSGEGLIGLTRAFQHAGARSVAASLWSVADQVTAELMARFHRHLAAGLPKDQALRAAQIELIREPLRITAASGQAVEMDASAPFFWAAFQLFGDWR